MSERTPERFVAEDLATADERSGQGAGVAQSDGGTREPSACGDLERRLDEARIGVWEWRADTRRMHCSPGAATLLGAGTAGLEASLEQYLSLIYPSDRVDVAQAIESAMASAADYRVEHRVCRGQGETRWITGVGRALCGENGKPNQIVGVLFDSTELRRSEDIRREHEETIRAMVESSRDWIWAIGTDGEFKYTNPAVEDILGYSPEELLGKVATSLIHEDDRPWLERELPGLVASRSGWKNVLLRWRHKNGEYRYIEANGIPICDSQGALKEFRGFARDATERIRFEEEKESLETQLLHAQKMEAVGRLAGGVAHDFNNLLTVILGNLDAALLHIAQEHSEDADLIEALHEAAAGAERAGALTSQLLAFSRRQVSRPEHVDINRQLSDLERMLRRLLAENIDLVVTLAPCLPPVRLDLGQFQQVVMNLVVNAGDAMPEGGRLTISTREQILDDASCLLGPGDRGRRSVVVSVVDTGVGIAPDAIDHVFEPFFTTKAVGEGTGLGLATVYGIVAQAGGHIQVSSAPGSGTRFDVWFPVAEVTRQKSMPLRAGAKRLPGGHETVLVCEDEPIVRRLIVRTLARAGYVVFEAESGPEAIRLVDHQKPALTLLVTDVIMPEMNGHRLGEELRRLYPALRILYCSGYTADVVSHQGVLPMGSGFLPKPFKTEALLQRVREVIDREPRE